MAEADNPSRFLGDADGTLDHEVAGGTVKTVYAAKNRLPEDSDDSVAGRVGAYYAAGEKDVLPEHQERRDAYPHIYAE